MRTTDDSTTTETSTLTFSTSAPTMPPLKHSTPRKLSQRRKVSSGDSGAAGKTREKKSRGRRRKREEGVSDVGVECVSGGEEEELMTSTPVERGVFEYILKFYIYFAFS